MSGSSDERPNPRFIVGTANMASFLFGNSSERKRVLALIVFGKLPVFRLGRLLILRVDQPTQRNGNNQ